MKKQRKRIYAALLCICMVLSLVSTPVSAAETGQMANIQEHTEELDPQESVSGNEAAGVSENEAAAALNGLSVSALTANRVAEVTTAKHLTDMLADSNPNKNHKFNPNSKYWWWYIDMWELDEDNGSEIVPGGVITGGGGDQNNGGDVYTGKSGTFTTIKSF